MKLRIAEIPPIWESLPPKGYGAIEYLVSSLTHEFTCRGHNVQTYASKDSCVAGKLIPVVNTSLNNGSYADSEVLRMMQFIRALENANNHDIIHCHLHSNTGWLGLPLLKDIHKKTVFSIHTFPTDANKKLIAMFPDCHFVAASRAHIASFGRPEVSDYVHHGVEMSDFQFKAVPENPPYLAFLGRIRPEKGVHLAIDVAYKTNLQLKIAGRVKEIDRSYFNEYVAPHVDSGRVEFLGEMNIKQKTSLMGGATAILYPTLIEEPFGLVVIEAMACGTPVIATGNGAMSELIINGVTGFTCASVEEMCNAVNKIHELERCSIRQIVEENFSAQKMAISFSKIFMRILNGEGKNESI